MTGAPEKRTVMALDVDRKVDTSAVGQPYFTFYKRGELSASARHGRARSGRGCSRHLVVRRSGGGDQRC